MRPHYPDSYEGCINGCDPTLCEILQVNISQSTSSYSNSLSTNRNSSTSYHSNTQNTNRNPAFQNRGEIILIYYVGFVYYYYNACILMLISTGNYNLLLIYNYKIYKILLTV